MWFHQFGGFGALARSADGEDVGYVLGVVTADRLAVPAPARRAGRPAPLGAGPPAVRGGSTSWPASTGARVVQAVTRPGNDARWRSTPRWGRSAHLSRDHAGPGDDRVVLTRSL